MKKIVKIVLLMAFAVFVFCGCGGNKEVLNEIETQNTITQKTDENNLENKESKVDEKQYEKQDEEVEIVFKMIDMNNEGIEKYVENYNANNPESECYVYNNECYAIKITESERLEFAEKLNDKNEIENLLKESFSKSGMDNIFTSLDCDDLMQSVSFYVNKEEYEKNGLAVNILFPLITVALSDSCQAYNLISVEERFLEYKIIDNKTMEVIYEYNSKDN